MDNYPSNSQRSKASEIESKTDRKVERVVKTEVVRRKKPLGRRISDTFAQADASTVWNFVVMDVILPAAKDMISEAVSQGIDQMLFGGEQRYRGRKGTGVGYGNPNTGSYTQYNRAGPNNGWAKGPVGPNISRRGRAAHNFDEIVLTTRVEAEEVIDRLFDLVSRFEMASVSDLYDLVGITPNFTDEKYGWTDLRGAGVSRVKGGYLLNLPRPEQID